MPKTIPILMLLLLFLAPACSDSDEGDEGWLLEGENCSNIGMPGCAKGLACVSNGSSGVCSTDYLGRCEPIPSNCNDVAYSPVCDCSGEQYDNLCELRKTGYENSVFTCPQ